MCLSCKMYYIQIDAQGRTYLIVMKYCMWITLYVIYYILISIEWKVRVIAYKTWISKWVLSNNEIVYRLQFVGRINSSVIPTPIESAEIRCIVINFRAPYSVHYHRESDLSSVTASSKSCIKEQIIIWGTTSIRILYHPLTFAAEYVFSNTHSEIINQIWERTLIGLNPQGGQMERLRITWPAMMPPCNRNLKSWTKKCI